VLQDDSTQGLHDAAEFFDDQLAQNPRSQTAPSKYGLAFIALKQGAVDKAQTLLREARTAAKAVRQPANAQPTFEAILDSLEIDVQLAAGRAIEAAKLAALAREKFPLSRGIARQYANCLTAEGRNDDAIIYLRDQAQLYRQEPQIQDLLAKAYAAEGKQALQHLALAESYALTGGLLSALEQLSIARKAPDASFYDNSVIDAREREFKSQWNEQQEELKNSKKL
jgi:predicted Zn-dependent protease